MPVVTVPVAPTPVAAAPALTAPRAHSWASTHAWRNMVAATTNAATTARSCCENWSSQNCRDKATQEKDKFRIIHNYQVFNH
jgi:hypothetical protein